ncbi:hypothetical protein GWK47_037610 [Chionoecetes opilio]|uniref:Endonuclease/exonuclease/phosphatase domain-containing protein n=1 Tax=Chionoecetes opilio TaxID=41210 RepID=A0A8J5CZ71_CHIOP|nr:hypothetical protein GWK47_037610 [Chionoecetes opilio]
MDALLEFEHFDLLDAAEAERIRLPRRIVKDRLDLFLSLTEEEFTSRFRLSKHSARTLLDDLNLPEANDAKETRNAVERAFGVMKRRFRYLSIPMRTSLDTTMATACTAAVLHNIARKFRDGLDDSDGEDGCAINGSTDRLTGCGAPRVECLGQHDKRKKFIAIVVYLTVEGHRAGRENRMKYNILKKIFRDHAGECVMVMGDMNAHLGMLGERINQNGEMLAEFIDELELENLNETVAEGRVTWNASNQESAIDCVGEWQNARRWIDEDGITDIVSDHTMLVVDCVMWSKSEPRVSQSQRPTQGHAAPHVCPMRPRSQLQIKYPSPVKRSPEKLKDVQDLMQYVIRDDPVYTKFFEDLIKDQEVEMGVVPRPAEEDPDDDFLDFCAFARVSSRRTT